MQRLTNEDASSGGRFAETINRLHERGFWPLPTDPSGKVKRVDSRNVVLLSTFAETGWDFSVDLREHGLVCLESEGGFTLDTAVHLRERGPGHPWRTIVKADHPGTRTLLIEGVKAKAVPRSKRVPLPLDMLSLVGLASHLKTTDLAPYMGKRQAKPKVSRTERLLAMQQDPVKLLRRMFPEGDIRPEGSGWRVSTNGMTDNIAANPHGKAGELMFVDFGEPPAFAPGDALAVIKQLDVSGKQDKRTQVADNESVGNESVAFKATSGKDRSRAALRLYRGAFDLHEEGDECAEALAYLEGRGVDVPKGAMIRFDPECPFGDDGEKAALIAGVTADLQPGQPKDVVAVQRIALDGAKKTLGKVVGAVNVSGEPVEDRLGVAEGVVTALAAQARMKMPFVATLGTGNMKELVVPDSVTELVIVADNDEKGQGESAAKALARRYANINTKVVMPEATGKDMADADCGAAVPVEFRLLDFLGGVDGLGESKFAAAFIERHGRQFKYDGRFAESNGAWVEWKDGQWVRRTLPPRRLTAAVIRSTCGEDDKAVKSFDKSSVQTGVLKTIAEGCERREWDSDPNLLGLPNGTVLDLVTGDVRDQTRKDYITRSTGAMPAEDEGEFASLVHHLCGGDTSMYELCRTLAVDCATGYAGKDLVPIVYGPPGTGKSTVWNAVHRALGSYSTVIDSKYLLASRSQSHSSWMAVLADKRMALTSEVPPGSTWNGPLVCTLTGGDAVSANFMRQNQFVFVPQFRMITLVNDLPEIPSSESGLMRRVRVLPFLVRVGTDSDDDSIREWFTGDGRGEVLRWIADAAREVNGRDPAHRYPYSKVVADATAAYTKDRSGFDTWAALAIQEGGPQDGVPIMDAYRAFMAWADKGGWRTMGKKAFERALHVRMGFPHERMRVHGANPAYAYRGRMLVEAPVRERKQGPRW